MCWPKEPLPTNKAGRATRFWICHCQSIQVRVFHITWFTFWLCFFGWFGTANLQKAITEDLGLSTKDKAYAGGSAVASTIIFRVLIGWICDKIGARYSYTILLIISGIPICLVSTVQNNVSYIIVHIFIGIVGASFVITQYHTTKMFSGNIVGIANATSAGWGNFGGGCANFLMPFFMSAIANNHDIPDTKAWRYAMLIPGFAYFIVAAIYFFCTQDTPKGNMEIKCGNNDDTKKQDPNKVQPSFKEGAGDYRTWILFIVYAACFGVELTVLRFATLYFQYQFGASEKVAGTIVLSFSLMNLFARSLGGGVADFVSNKFKTNAIQSRVWTLFIVLLLEAVFIALFALGRWVNTIAYSIFMLLCFSMCVQSAEGVTFAVVPFVRPNSVGPVAGIVGAGGNVGAMIFAFALFAYVPDNLSYEAAWFILAAFVFIASFSCLLISFTKEETAIANEKMKEIKTDDTVKIDDNETAKLTTDAESVVTNSSAGNLTTSPSEGNHDDIEMADL